jgi:hypothetical protein
MGKGPFKGEPPGLPTSALFFVSFSSTTTADIALGDTSPSSSLGVSISAEWGQFGQGASDLVEWLPSSNIPQWFGKNGGGIRAVVRPDDFNNTLSTDRMVVMDLSEGVGPSAFASNFNRMTLQYESGSSTPGWKTIWWDPEGSVIIDHQFTTGQLASNQVYEIEMNWRNVNNTPAVASIWFFLDGVVGSNHSVGASVIFDTPPSNLERLRIGNNREAQNSDNWKGNIKKFRINAEPFRDKNNEYTPEF